MIDFFLEWWSAATHDMRDLASAKAMLLKAGLFFILALLCALGLWAAAPSLKTAILIAVLVWSSARLYYFLFYVLQTYVEVGDRRIDVA